MKSMKNMSKFVFVVTITGLLLTSCAATNSLFGKRDNGSLDYQESTLLAPLQIPVDKKTQPFIAVYPVIDLGESKIKIVNDSGTQYEMPKPNRLVK